MADPLTLTAIGAFAAYEGIKFFYGQATEVMTKWRQRRVDESTADVPFINAELLDGTPSRWVVDFDVIDAERMKMTKLIGALHPYASGMDDVALDDAELAQNAGDLRAILEAAYGQRLTLAGENRDSTGTRVEVRQVLDSVSGRVVGAESDVSGGALSVDQRAKEVTSEGTIIGFQGQIRGPGSA